jgi:hypothetical protein
MMATAGWKMGQMVECDGLLAVVVGTDAESWVPEDHVALWFGDPKAIRKSEGGPGASRPEVWTVPADLCNPTAAFDVRH